MCTDETGRTYTSDRPIPECQGRALRHYGKSGSVVRDIPAPPTAEERRQQQLEAEKKRELERARREQVRQDRALLAAYRHEEDIIAAREQAAAPLHEIIKYEREALSKAEERRGQALVRLVQAEGNKEMNAAEWRRRADAADVTVKASTAKLRGYEEELAQLRREYDAKIRRFRELQGEEASAALLP